MTTTKKPSMRTAGAATAAVAVAVAVGRGDEATEEQARAIISAAKRAVEEAKTRADGGASSAVGKKPSSSLKRSLECFLEGRRKNKASSSSSAATRRRHLETSTTSSSSSSSN